MKILYFFLWFLISATSIAYADPFTIPEKFVYDLTWTGIKAGTASLELINDGDKLKIISTAQSAKWVSVFYTVDDRIESILSKTSSPFLIGQPISYRMKIREGRHRRDKEVIFDHTNGSAKYIDYLNNEKKEFVIPPVVYDPISSFYYLRTLKLITGKSVYVTIFDSKKVWNVEVQVLRKEQVILPIGTFDTLVVKPLMKSEGIFYRKGEILIWLTDDIKHIPVKLQTKVAVGSITATLVQGYY
ncbi:MAG: DUF3108 domain-containing protein [Nitrospira sp.]|nr:DUF3108 domain-containing protein [Nitrospira sp.]